MATYSFVTDGPWVSSTNKFIIRKNKVNLPMASFGSPIKALEAGKAVIGSENALANNLLESWVMEVMVWKRSLSTSELTRIEDYHMSKLNCLPSRPSLTLAPG